MITSNRNGKTYIRCGRCQKLVVPRNGNSDINMIKEGNADYFCEECANAVSEDDGDSCLICHYEFVKDEIRYTFQMHSTINVKRLYKKEELCVVGNICERCRNMVEKIVTMNTKINN